MENISCHYKTFLKRKLEIKKVESKHKINLDIIKDDRRRKIFLYYFFRLEFFLKSTLIRTKHFNGLKRTKVDFHYEWSQLCLQRNFVVEKGFKVEKMLFKKAKYLNMLTLRQSKILCWMNFCENLGFFRRLKEFKSNPK